MKRFLSSVCCALTLWLAMVVGVSQAQAQNLTVKFTFTDNTEQTFSGQSTLADAFSGVDLTGVKELEISAGEFVTKDWETIKENKSNLAALEKFTITDDVTSVADIPFGNNPVDRPLSIQTLKEVSIAKVKNINNAFKIVPSLNKVELPDVTDIGSECFRGASIATLSLPKLENIDKNAFEACSLLVSVDFPIVRVIPVKAFTGCSKLKNVNLPNAIEIHQNAFYNCANLVFVELPLVDSIGEGIFNGCNSLVTIKLPNVTKVANMAFSGLTALKTLELNALQRTILQGTITNSNGDLQRMIYSCTVLESIEFPELLTITGQTLRGCDVLKSVSLPKITEMQNKTLFYSSYALEEIRLPAIPPSYVGPNTFSHQNGEKGIIPRKLVIVGSDGTPLTGEELATAKSAYYQVNDAGATYATKHGVTNTGVNDELWFGWHIVSHFEIKALFNSNEGGVTGIGVYAEGEDVILIAVPAAGYRFVKWTENGSDVGTDVSITFTAAQDHTVTAVFELIPTYNITATANPTEGGTVTGDGTYNHGESVTLTATANEGYHFVNWTEGGNVVSTNASYTFTADQARTLVAQFELNSYTITATANPTEGGTVTGDGSYNHGETVSLTASPNSGYTFAGWYNGLTFLDNNSPYSFAATEAANIIAKFDTIKVTNITLDKTGTLLRKVGDTPVQITATIEPVDALDKTITWTSSNELVATVADGLVQFVGVGYTTITATAASGVSASCIVNVNPAKYSITVDPNITNGEIMNSPSEAAAGDQVDLFVTPESGYQLVAGSLKVNGDASIVEPNGINQYKFSMPAEDVLITAQFEQMGYIINVTANPNEGGVVSGAGIYSDGETITITATPNAGYTFKQWNDNNTESSRSVVVSGNADYIAEFEEIVLNSISLNPATLTIPSTSVLPYDIMVVFDPEDALNREFDWEISDQNVILNVSPYPSLISIAANNPGTATITVTSRANPNLVATCEVTVVDGDLPVQGVSLNQTSLTLLEGRAFQLKATTDPVAASNQKMTWTCTDESVVTINASAYYCLVVAKSAGTATVTVRTEDGGYEASCEIIVEALPSVESIALNSTAVTLEIAETHQLQATVLPAEANQSVSWSSNNEAVATVVDGEITAVAMGTVIITATTDDGGHTAHCVVNVNNSTLPDAIASFEDLTLVKADTFWTGASNPDGLFTSFVSGTYRFVNTSGWGGTYWAGFAYTNTTATDAASWNTTNVGTGIGGSQNYGVAYYSSWDFPTGITVERTNTSDAKPVSGMYVTNTAQVIDVLNNGNAFARKFEQGDWFKLTATADNGNSLDFYLADFRSSDATEHYIVDSWEWLDLSPLGDVKTVSFTMSSSDIGAYGVNTPTYFAFDDFGGVAPTFTLTYTAGPNGTVEGQQSVTQVVSYGKDGDEVIATPATGYQFLRWSDGLSWGNGSRRDYNVKENINVTAEFIPNGTTLHYIQYFVSSGGSIKGQASQRVADGQSSIEVKAVAKNGYRFDKWNDGNEQAARFESDVHNDNSYTAYFIKQIRVDYMVSGYGRIEGTAIQVVDKGVSTTAVTAIPSEGYRFVKWSDGVTEATRTDIIDLNIDDTTFVAVFELQTYNITVVTPTNGTLTASKTADIAEGKEITLTATPDDGYQLKAIKAYKTGDANTVVSVDNGKFTMPAYDVTVEAEFEKTATTGLFYNITVSTPTNGTLTASKTSDIAEGDEITLTVTPDDGYQLKAIKAYKTGDANTVVSVDNGKFTMPAYDVTVEAEFEKIATTGLFSIERESLTLTAYPNPTVGAVQVEANGMVMVYNAAGQLLQRVPAQGKVLIDLSSYPAGFYFVVVGKVKATIVKQ